MNSMGKLLILVAGSFFLYFLRALLKAFYNYWWIPHRIQNILRSQGIKGPPYEFIHGNNKAVVESIREASSKPMALTHDIFPRVLPHIYSCINTYALIKILHKYWWTPLRIQYAMNLQGIKGPPYKFIHGNNKETVKMKQEALSKPMASLSHDIFPRVNPPVYSRINSYVGKNYLSWGGTTAQLFITEPELVKEVLKSSERAFPKRTSRERKRNEDEFALKILGDGLVTSEGEKWARQRKLANYAFHGDSLKSMTPAVIASVETMLERWKQFEGKEIDVFEDFRLLTSEVISRTAFGSSYLDGKKIFDMLLKLSVLTNRNLFKAKFPETTNSALAWAVLLLAINPDWQEKARREVIEVFGNQNPHSEGIGRLKTMTMIINETLRLYPPINSMVRKVENEVQLGKLILPADLHVVVPIVALHHDPQLWGDDANLFKPERFSEGISNATKHNAAAYIPFGLGPRSCVGMSFAMTEAKTALSMILQRYTISLSPTYSHSPCTLLLLQPQHGIQWRVLAFSCKVACVFLQSVFGASLLLGAALGLSSAQVRAASFRLFFAMVDGSMLLVCARPVSFLLVVFDALQGLLSCQLVAQV
ncbi:Cytochrome P450 - like 10 [Theobroma cacao]|nr:Cytochrome P450 - like 10 [Theobroma cacao]